MAACSTVWLAPQPCSSGGRSAENRSIGTPARLASTTAGSQLAGAVPEVASSTAGCPLARARPSAKNAAARSSTATWQVKPSWRSRASASGVEREPGEITASRTPAACRPATSACDQRKFSVAVSFIGVGNACMGWSGSTACASAVSRPGPGRVRAASAGSGWRRGAARGRSPYPPRRRRPPTRRPPAGRSSPARRPRRRRRRVRP